MEVTLLASVGVVVSIKVGVENIIFSINVRFSVCMCAGVGRWCVGVSQGQW